MQTLPYIRQEPFNVQLNSLYNSQEPPEQISHLASFAFCHVLIYCVCCDCFPSTNYFTALSAKIACHSRAYRCSSWKKISTNNNWLRKPVPLSTHHRMPHTTCHLPHYHKSYQRKTYVRVRRKGALARQLHLELCSATRHKKLTTKHCLRQDMWTTFLWRPSGTQPQVMRIYLCGKWLALEGNVQSCKKNSQMITLYYNTPPIIIHLLALWKPN